MTWTTQKYINLRASQAYVTDGANQTSLNDDDVGSGVYPISVTLDSDTFDIGWVTDLPQYRDRDDTADPRLAGLHFATNDGTSVRTLRINVPAGNIGVRLAFGDPINDRTYTEWAIYDDTSLLDTNVYASTITGGQWVDADETLRADNAAWISSNAERIYAISSGILLIKIGSVATQTDVTALATVGFRQIAGGTVNTSTLSDSISLSDIAAGFCVRGNVSSEAISIVDSFFLWWYRTRVLQSVVIVTEGATDVYTTTNMQAIDELTVSDEFIVWLRRNRLLDDGISISDELIATTIGYLIFISVLSSQITVTDHGLPIRFFSRLVDSEILTSDQTMRAVFVARTLLDTVDVEDQGLTALQRFILLTDALSVDDSLSSLLVSPVTSNPVILIGFDQPRIEVGGYGL